MEDIETFLAVIEAGSQTAAARRLGRSLQSVNRSLLALERRIGVELVRRTTRRSAATEAGQAFYRRVKPAFTEISEAHRDVARRAMAARGQGHSTYGRAMTENGIVVDMSAFGAIGPVEADRVAVDAGATWEAVLDATLPHSLTPPVLTNYLGLSVGGTLAVGGIGGTSSRFGFQTDNVLELEVVTGSGETLTCSAAAMQIEYPRRFRRRRIGPLCN